MAEPDWVLFERQIKDHIPELKQTSGSGTTWGDGDGMTSDLCFEAKRHQRVSFDTWWKQTRRQAEKWHKTPCLVIWRPPVELQFGPAPEDEVLAVVPLEYLGELRRKLATAKRQFAEMEEVNVLLEERIQELEDDE